MKNLLRRLGLAGLLTAGTLAGIGCKENIKESNIYTNRQLVEARANLELKAKEIFSLYLTGSEANKEETMKKISGILDRYNEAERKEIMGIWEKMRTAYDKAHAGALEERTKYEDLLRRLFTTTITSARPGEIGRTGLPPEESRDIFKVGFNYQVHGDAEAYGVTLGPRWEINPNTYWGINLGVDSMSDKETTSFGSASLQSTGINLEAELGLKTDNQRHNFYGGVYAGGRMEINNGDITLITPNGPLRKDIHETETMPIAGAKGGYVYSNGTFTAGVEAGPQYIGGNNDDHMGGEITGYFGVNF